MFYWSFSKCGCLQIFLNFMVQKAILSLTEIHEKKDNCVAYPCRPSSIKICSKNWGNAICFTWFVVRNMSAPTFLLRKSIKDKMEIISLKQYQSRKLMFNVMYMYNCSQKWSCSFLFLFRLSWPYSRVLYYIMLFDTCLYKTIFWNANLHDCICVILFNFWTLMPKF